MREHPERRRVYLPGLYGYFLDGTGSGSDSAVRGLSILSFLATGVADLRVLTL